MNIFKNRLVSVILSAVTFVGAVTTCLVSDSSVRYCKAEHTQSPTIQEVGSIMNKLAPKVMSRFSRDPNFLGASHFHQKSETIATAGTLSEQIFP